MILTDINKKQALAYQHPKCEVEGEGENGYFGKGPAKL